MAVKKSVFSGSKIDSRIRCTSSEGRLCSIFENLRVWNEFFWPLGFELRELSPGLLSLVAVREWTCYLVEENRRDAVMLLLHLLARHHCVASVDLNDTILRGHDKLMRDALHRSPSLRKLKLCPRGLATSASLSFVATLPKLNQLQELELCDVPFDRATLRGLSKLLSRTRSLTTLDMTRQNIKGQDAIILIQGLERNATITTLSINVHLQGSHSSKCASMFTQYLRLNQTLRTLNLTTPDRFHMNDFGPTIGALFHNNHLLELNLIGFKLDSHQNELITSMLIQNGHLRSLHMLDRFINLEPSIVGPIYFNFRSEACLLSLWLVALAENKTLNELTLVVLLGMEPNDYQLFFQALACNTSLKKVNFLKFKDEDVAEICRAVREAGVQERVSLGKQCIWQETTAPLSECKEVSCVKLKRWEHFHDEPLLITLRQLPMCSHVNSLCLYMAMEGMDERWKSLMVQYITKTTALRELLFVHDNKDALHTALFEQTLLQALVNNKSIRKLSILRFDFGEIESQMLADVLDSSRTLCDLSVCTFPTASTVSLMHKLSTVIMTNYTLLRANLSWPVRWLAEWFTIDDVVRRNNSLVTRAAHFIMGTRHKYCGAAVELIRFNPRLVDKVQELACVDEYEAASLIKKCLKGISELEDFMRLVGVVKGTVTCHRREDGQKQIVDLNRDCWLHIRQFIKVGDILD